MKLQFKYSIDINSIQYNHLANKISKFTDKDYENKEVKLIYSIRDTLVLFEIAPGIASEVTEEVFKK
jgi:hypothetical protein